MSSVRSLLTLALLGWWPLVSVRADSDFYSLDAHIITAGSSAQARSSCFRVDALIAEPLAGFSSSIDFTLSAGFVAARVAPSDAIFFSGFEDCTS